MAAGSANRLNLPVGALARSHQWQAFRLDAAFSRVQSLQVSGGSGGEVPDISDPSLPHNQDWYR